MNTANELAVGIIVLAIIAVLAHANGAPSLVTAIGNGLSWSAGLFAGLVKRGQGQ